MNNDVFTTFQAAEFCHTSFMSIKRWIQSGKLFAFKTPGGHYRILGKDLINFMKKNNIPIIKNIQPIWKKILIVDDETPIRDTISQFLRMNGNNFELATAEDGFEAGILVNQFMPDLILLDLMMPKMDGFKVCEKIKTNPTTKNIKLIVMTGFGTNENIKKAYDCGADKVLEKPFELQTLLEEINTII